MDIGSIINTSVSSRQKRSIHEETKINVPNKHVKFNDIVLLPQPQQPLNNDQIDVIQKQKRTVKEKLQRNIDFAQKDMQSQIDQPRKKERFLKAFKKDPLEDTINIYYFTPEMKYKDMVLPSKKVDVFLEIKKESYSMMKTHQGMISAAISSCIGTRETMEDEALIEQLNVQVKDQKYCMTVFGVFDGHGGPLTSKAIKDRVSDAIIDYLEDSRSHDSLTEEVIFSSLKMGIKALNDDLEDKETEQGSTLALVVLLQDKIWVVNTGDSRTILMDEEGKVTQASDDMKLTSERYRSKIAQHILIGNRGIERLDGRLTMTRAIGDHTMPHISAHPKITCYDYEKFKKGKIVIACDGLWDVTSSQNVGDCINTIKDKPAQEISQRLVYSAINAGSGDNVTVLVVNL